MPVNTEQIRLHRWSSLLAAMILLVLSAGCGQRSSRNATEAQPVSVLLDTNSIFVGDPVTTTLIVQHPTGTVIEAPIPAPEEQVMMRNRSVETTTKDQHALTKIVYHLTSFTLGEHALFTNGVKVTGMAGEGVQWPVPETSLTVRSILGDTEHDRLKDIKGLTAWRRSFRFLLWLALICVAAVIGVLIWRRFFCATYKPAVKPSPPPPPPHEVALRALQRLWERKYIEQQKIEPFYVELSDIVRRYLEDRFHLRAPEQTTEEFIRAAGESRMLAGDHRQLTRDFLEQCDLVKFARFKPDSDTMKNAWHSAEKLVKETTPTHPTPDKPLSTEVEP